MERKGKRRKRKERKRKESSFDWMLNNILSLFINKKKTERLKSALYLKLKKRKVSKKGQNVFMKSPEYRFKTPRRCLSCSIRLENRFPPTGNKEKLFRTLFFQKKLHSAVNTKESSMLAKRFVSSASRGGFDQSKLGKSHMGKALVLKINIQTWCAETA